jgi:hypothetical protein
VVGLMHSGCITAFGCRLYLAWNANAGMPTRGAATQTLNSSNISVA